MENALLLDVRSEGEFSTDTIPGAVNIPVLDNNERARVGPISPGRAAACQKAGFRAGGVKTIIFSGCCRVHRNRQFCCFLLAWG
ncbi:MAG: rhodanese-like domain-containing protein [Candidatus Syntrophopropionicum ammoniitolerans]